MTIHRRAEETKTWCGKHDVRNTLDRQFGGLPQIQPRIKTDDWTQVDCKSCLKLYRYPNGKKGFTNRTL